MKILLVGAGGYGIVYVFENATVRFSEDADSMIRATFRDGTEKCYGNPFADDSKKLWDTVATIKENKVPVCTVKTAIAHIELIDLLHQTTTYRPFEKDSVVLNASADGVYVKGLFDQIYRAYDSAALLSELT